MKGLSLFVDSWSHRAGSSSKTLPLEDDLDQQQQQLPRGELVRMSDFRPPILASQIGSCILTRSQAIPEHGDA